MSRALLIIDVQESFRQRPIWRTVSDPKLADHLLPVVEAARAAGDEVIWVLHSEPGTGSTFDPESGFVTILPPLSPAEHEPVLTKTSHNAFTTTSLQQLLTSRGVTELVITGLRTEQCCETTARHASDLGFQVRYVTDATLTFPMHTRSGREVSAAEIRERTEMVLDGRFAHIVSTAGALA